MNPAKDRQFRFQLAGARFSRLIVDESPMSNEGGDELLVQVTRSAPVVSDQLYGDRPVIEIKVGVMGSLDGTDPAKATNRIFHVECTAGFVGTSTKHDGDLSAFADCLESYVRGTYWMLRERVDSLFSVTRMRGTVLPWDVFPADLKPDGDPPTRGTKTSVPVKRSAPRKKSVKPAKKDSQVRTDER